MAVNLVQKDDGSVALKNEVDGKEIARVGGVPSANATSTVPAWRLPKTVIVPLVATAGVGAAIAQWQNPDSHAYYVKSVLLDIQTGSTASCTVNVDVGSVATSSGTGIWSLRDLSQTGVINNFNTANGKGYAKLSANQYVNVIMTAGSATGLVGVAIIELVAA